MLIVPYLIIVIVLSLPISAYLIYRKKKSSIMQREEKSFGRIYDEFFSTSNIDKDDAKKLWDEIAHSLDLPPLQLLPSDRLDKELQYLISAMDSDFDWLIDDLIDERGLDRINLQNANSLQDFIVFLSKKTV